MRNTTWRLLLAGVAVLAASVSAHDSGSPPYTGYSGPDIETACEDFEIDTDGTLEAVCHAPVVETGVPYDQNTGKVQHISADIELKEKIQFASGSLSMGGSGGFDTLCSSISISSSSTAVTLSASCDDDPDDSTAATDETLDISNNIVVHSNGDFAWYVAPSGS